MYAHCCVLNIIFMNAVSYVSPTWLKLSYTHDCRVSYIIHTTAIYDTHDSYVYISYTCLTYHHTHDCRVYISCKYLPCLTLLTPHEKILGIRGVSNPSTIIDPGSLKMSFLVPIQNAGFVRDNGTNYTKEGHKGRNPVSKKLLGRSNRHRTHSPYQLQGAIRGGFG